MVVISDIPDDSDNGGAPNKNPQEPEKKPAAETPRTSLDSLPDVLIEHIVVHVPRCDHPAASLLLKRIRDIIKSPDFLLTRSRLSITEHVLYALIGFPPFRPRWYILYRSNAPSRLRIVDELPPMPYGCAVVTIGHEIYVIGGCDISLRYLTDVTVINCRTHTWRSLPKMRVARFHAAAGVTDGRIYVLGGCENQSEGWFEYFDLERQIWIVSTANLSYVGRGFVTYAVMKEKLYALSPHCLNIFDRKGDELITWLNATELSGLWQASSCVVDDMLYTIDPGYTRGYPIIVFDTEEDVWKPVRGVRMLPPSLFWFAYESRMANLGGKLVVLVGNQSHFWGYYGDKYIWCVEIGLERREDGEICGKIESVDLVFKTTKSTATPIIVLCRTVIV